VYHGVRPLGTLFNLNFLYIIKFIDLSNEFRYDEIRLKLYMWLIGIWRMGKAHTVGERDTKP